MASSEENVEQFCCITGKVIIRGYAWHVKLSNEKQGQTVYLGAVDWQIRKDANKQLDTFKDDQTNQYRDRRLKLDQK